jgi:hypothetical protein
LAGLEKLASLRQARNRQATPRKTLDWGEKRGNSNPEIIFGGICSFSIIGNDETNVSVVACTSTYRD